jgi:hypothetical protein
LGLIFSHNHRSLIAAGLPSSPRVQTQIAFLFLLSMALDATFYQQWPNT